MTSIQCFMLEDSHRDRRSLRRYRNGKAEESPCPVNGYHTVKVFLDEVADDQESSIGDTWPHNDPRWPVACECGYRFVEEDQWQLFRESLFRRTDTDESFPLMEAPPGAMWDAHWMKRNRIWTGETGKFIGPDGLCLMVKTPAGEWCVDGPSSNGSGWTRSGTPPNVTASPSIGVGEPMRYHGWLRDGVLVDA